jgi:hypothetical protein
MAARAHEDLFAAWSGTGEGEGRVGEEIERTSAKVVGAIASIVLKSARENIVV